MIYKSVQNYLLKGAVILSLFDGRDKIFQDYSRIREGTAKVWALRSFQRVLQNKAEKMSPILFLSYLATTWYLSNFLMNLTFQERNGGGEAGDPGDGDHGS
jgi:hypothetical protein